jgi:hypothetical protein
MNSPHQPQNKKKIVAVSKPLPKLVHELARLQLEEPGKLKLIIDKHGTIVATTLDIKPQKRSKENEQQ